MKHPIASLKPYDWPDIDQRLWAAAREDGDFFDDAGPAAHWAAATITNVEYSYGVWLGWLGQQGLLDGAATPAERVGQERVRAFIDIYSPGRSPVTVAGKVSGLAAFLRCTHPPDGLPWCSRLADGMKKRAKPGRAKPPRMSSPAELIEAGLELFGEGMAMLETSGHVNGAVRVRDGLMILMLAARPIRRRNLCGMRLGETVFVTERQVRADFPPSQTKAGNRIAFSYPTWLRPMIDDYLAQARPLLFNNPYSPVIHDEGWFWLSTRGNALSPECVTTRIPKVVKAGTGRATNLHLFRHCAATEIALRDPEHVGIVKDVLQHRSARTGQAYYIQARMAAALDDWADVIADIRKEAI